MLKWNIAFHKQLTERSAFIFILIKNAGVGGGHMGKEERGERIT